MSFRFSPRPNRAHEIVWRDWGPEAFAQATHEGKPVLLSISAIWCHWCHVMDESSYSDPDVIALANEQFIPVRVDNDQRPDVNSRYNLGGWPTTALLAPSGQLLAGGTYFPPPEMLRLLHTVSTQWQTDRQSIEERINQQTQHELPSSNALLSPVEERGHEILSDLAETIAGQLDLEMGGFGTDAKFPVPSAIEFLLAWHQQQRLNGTPIDGLERGLRVTLDAMLKGELRDAEEGGFFRYCTRRDWTVPHYEKMLGDNAALIRVYLAAGTLFGEPAYHRVADETAGYVTHVLTDPSTGAFWGSQDADEEYYRASLEQRRERTTPFVDPTTYADWSSQGVLAFLEAAAALGREELAERGLRALRFQLDHLVRPERGTAHYYAKEPQLFGLLADQTWTILALIRAYEQTAEREWLAAAESLAEDAQGYLADRESGGFFDRLPAPEAGLVAVAHKPIDDNGRMAEALIRLGWLTGKESYREAARGALGLEFDRLPLYQTFAAAPGKALLLYLASPVQIEVVGGGEQTLARDLLRRALALFDPTAFVRTLDSRRDAAQIGARGYDPQRTAAYVCLDGRCLEPAFDLDALDARIREVGGG